MPTSYDDCQDLGVTFTHEPLFQNWTDPSRWWFQQTKRFSKILEVLHHQVNHSAGPIRAFKFYIF